MLETGEQKKVDKNRDNVLLTIFCFIAAFFCYQTVLPLIFPEMAYFYHMYGNAPTPTLNQVISAYNIFQPGWYRPTSFFLFPYLLCLNYLNPTGVISFNIIFFALTCSVVPILFLHKSDLPTKLLSSIIILTSPSLVAVTYFPTIDSLHILFSLLFIMTFESKVMSKKISGVAFASLIFWYLAAITCKESAAITPILALLYTIINNTDRHQQRKKLLQKIVGLALPFLLASAIYYCLYMVAKGVITDPVYANIPTFHKLPKILKLLYATMNIHLPFVPGDDIPTSGYLKTGNLLWGAIWFITIGLIWWRRKTFTPVILLCTILLLSILYLLSGMAGGHFHHVFPMMVCISILIGRLGTFPEINSPQGLRTSPRIQTIKKIIQLSMIGGLILSCNTYTSEILKRGEHRRELLVNTALFHDQEIFDLAHRDDVYLLVESAPWDVGANTGVLHYFGRKPNNNVSEEYVVKISPEVISRVARTYPNKTIYGLSLEDRTPPYKIRELLPFPRK